MLLDVFLVSLLAGLGTGLGGAIAALLKPGKKMFGFLVGMASGVMLTLAFTELLQKAWTLGGNAMAVGGFAFGALFMLAIDSLLPHMRFSERESNVFDHKLMRTGLLVAIGIAIHNVPEGIAVGAGYTHAPEFGIFIALAIALHNIPEGIATCLPLCKSGFCRRKAFATSLFSGLAEPLGAVAAAAFLSSYAPMIPASLAFAAGVMVFITLDELIPAAREYGHHHTTSLGIILGSIAIMIFSSVFSM